MASQQGLAAYPQNKGQASRAALDQVYRRNNRQLIPEGVARCWKAKIKTISVAEVLKFHDQDSIQDIRYEHHQQRSGESYHPQLEYDYRIPRLNVYLLERVYLTT